MWRGGGGGAISRTVTRYIGPLLYRDTKNTPENVLRYRNTDTVQTLYRDTEIQIRNVFLKYYRDTFVSRYCPTLAIGHVRISGYRHGNIQVSS
ncbi:MAG: hypothetical protein PV344_05730 [Anaplasma sp.]|nr:hypothetical protein [Anaplasma sp.]